MSDPIDRGPKPGERSTRGVFVDEFGAPRRDRRRQVQLSDEQVAQIATAAARQAVQLMVSDGYRAVGKNVVEKGLWIIGVIVLGLFSLAVGKGWIKF